MTLMFSLLLIGTTPGTAESPPCPDIRDATVVLEVSGLPDAIATDLAQFAKDLAPRNSEIRRTDAPTPAEQTLPRARFLHGIRVRGMWFVSYEIGQQGSRTIGYVNGASGRLQRSPSNYFGGPPCKSIQAALDGVITPGGFDF